MSSKYQKIIGFAGQLANGKNVAGEHLRDVLNSKDFLNNKSNNHLNLKWIDIAFGDALKDMVCNEYDISRSDLELHKRKNEPMEGMDLPIRKIMQMLGDDFRKGKQLHWISKLFNSEKAKNKNLVITDARYVNEAKAVRERGGKMILIYRPKYENDIDHPSESQYKEYINYFKEKGNSAEGPIDIQDVPFDWYLINSEGIDELKDKVEKIANEWKNTYLKYTYN